MNTTLAAASSQIAFAGANFTTFSAVAVESSLAGMSVQRNNDSYKHIQTPIEHFGERVLKPAVDSLGYWASRSIELLNSFLSFPEADAAQTSRRSEPDHGPVEITPSVLSRIATLADQFHGATPKARNHLVADAEFLLELAEKNKIVDPQVGLLATELGDFFRITRNFPKARAYCEQGVDAHIAANQPDSLALATSYNGLADVLKTEGKLPEAKAYYDKALQILLKQYETKEHSDIGLVYNNLSIVSLGLGDKVSAERFARQAVQTNNALYATEGHVNLAMAHNSLGNVQKTQGNLLGAQHSFQESLRILELLNEPENKIHISIAYNNLGTVLHANRDFTGAKMNLQKALDMKEEIYGSSSHSEIAISHLSIAALLADEGDLDEAAATYRKAISIFIANYKTENHPNVALSLTKLGLVLLGKQDFAGALECFERVVAIKESLQDNPHELATSYKNLALAYNDTGAFGKAAETFEKSIAAYRISAHTAEDSMDVFTGYRHIGDISFALGQIERAKLAYQEAKEVSHMLYGSQYDTFFDEKIETCEEREQKTIGRT